MFVMFNVTNIISVLFLIFLEGILSLDNALVLALMVKHLPAAQQRRALTWGIWGAVGFRFIALFFLTTILQFTWVKLLGSGYLFFIAIKGIVSDGEEEPSAASTGMMAMWRTILLVEIVDIAFSADSILAAVSLTQSYWILVLGGVLGIVMMRFAAILFIKLLRAFPRMAETAYYLVFAIACKLALETLGIGLDFHSSSSPETWLFWAAMIACLCNGFRSNRLEKA